ncbi:MAG TPA: peptide chain release factor N(5)-glutamine methyltransferase [Puia sp.]|nr:peptide chain release factor N(5)-glutamine methyltransferase [Puia sp.]
MNLQQAQQEMVSQLRTLYEDREAATITDWVMEKITGWKKLDRIIHKNMPLAAEGMEMFRRYTRELLAHRPVQYVLQEAWFAGLKFFVDESVLIPRPETEELVDWVAEEAGSLPFPDQAPVSKAPHRGISILDVGTGSGCIAIALKRRLPGNPVYACDLSEAALAIAQHNAASNKADIQFLQLDFLDSSAWASLPPIQVLVSNPPYIPVREKDSMAPHVVGFEPHLALFVPDQDPLVFYRALAHVGLKKLLPGGQIFAEIHEGLGAEVVREFEEAGFHPVSLKKDMQGKDRMIKATR